MVELQDKVEWNRAKLEFQNKLQVGVQVSRKVETGRGPVSKFKVFMSDVEIEKATANAAQCKSVELPPQ